MFVERPGLPSQSLVSPMGSERSTFLRILSVFPSSLRSYGIPRVSNLFPRQFPQAIGIAGVPNLGAGAIAACSLKTTERQTTAALVRADSVNLRGGGIRLAIFAPQ